MPRPTATAPATLSPLEVAALANLREHCAAWGSALPEDVAGNPEPLPYLSKAQASRALASLARKGYAVRKRGRVPGWRGSVYLLPALPPPPPEVPPVI